MAQILIYDCEICGIGVEYQDNDMTEYNEHSECANCFDKTVR